MYHFKEKDGSERSYQNHNQIGRFGTALAAVREQIEAGKMPPQDRAQAEEIASIIAEVLCLNPDSEISIGGEKISAALVSEIFFRIDSDRVRAVIRRYREATYKITHPKSYLRTALYNSVFDFEASVENEVIRDMPYLASGGRAND